MYNINVYSKNLLIRRGFSLLLYMTTIFNFKVAPDECFLMLTAAQAA